LFTLLTQTARKGLLEECSGKLEKYPDLLHKYSKDE